MTGTEFISNTARGAGGGAESLSAALSGVVFLNNRCLDAGCYGGALAVFDNLMLVGSKFLSNTAMGNGGGLYAAYSASVSDGLFQNNQCLQANCRAGGFFSENQFGTTTAVNNTQFIANRSQTDGGALYSNGTLTVTGGLFQANQCLEASCGGGGLAAAAGLTLTGTQFISNSAGAFGGGLEAFSAATLSGGLFRSNHSDTGGGLTHLTGDAQVVNSLFAGNSAANGGQALLLELTGSVAVLHSTLVGGNGAAIEILSGTVGITDSIIASYTVGISLTAGAARESSNLFFGNGTNVLGAVTPGGGDVSGDPLFVNPAAGNYHLRRGSPAIDSGVDAGVTTDVDGEARPRDAGFDIGYDEYINYAPVAAGAAYTTTKNTVLVVPAPGLLATGSDANSDPFTALLVTPPPSGTLVVNANGALTYTPPLDFTGVVFWTYALTDGLASSNPTLASITVSPPPACMLYLPVASRH